MLKRIASVFCWRLRKSLTLQDASRTLLKHFGGKSACVGNGLVGRWSFLSRDYQSFRLLRGLFPRSEAIVG